MPILFCVTKLCYNTYDTLLQKLTQKRRDYFILHLVVTLVIIFKNTHADKEQSGSGGKDEVKKLDFYDTMHVLLQKCSFFSLMIFESHKRLI